MLRTQEILRSGVALEVLVAFYGLRVDELGDLVLLNYGPESDKVSNVCMECRSLILERDTWNVVSMAFMRFYNAHEPQAADIDWTTATAEEKMDGSLVHLFYHGGRWRISTRGKLDALGETGAKAPYHTFNTLIWKTLTAQWEGVKEHGINNPQTPRLDLLQRGVSYIFELVSPHNRILKHYKEPALYLLTARHLDTLEEFTPEACDWIAEQQGWLRPARYDFISLDQVKEATERLDLTDEGYVVVDEDGDRIKVKSRSYLHLHKMLCGGNPNFWELMFEGQADEFLGYFPEFEKDILDKRYLLGIMLGAGNALYKKYNHLEVQKDFALAVKDHVLSGLLFEARKKGAETVSDQWEKLDTSRKLSIVKRVFEEQEATCSI